jgi:hypothetical protein
MPMMHVSDAAVPFAVPRFASNVLSTLFTMAQNGMNS